jgi:hypothetical protein
MRSFYNYKLYCESIESQIAGKRENPAKVMRFKDNKYGNIRIILGIGNDDEFHAFREDEFLYVLAVNHHMGYLGVDAYDLSDGADDAGSAFLQSSEEIDEIIGKNWEDLTPMTLVKRLVGLTMD